MEKKRDFMGIARPMMFSDTLNPKDREYFEKQFSLCKDCSKDAIEKTEMCDSCKKRILKG